MFVFNGIAVAVFDQAFCCAFVLLALGGRLRLYVGPRRPTASMAEMLGVRLATVLAGVVLAVFHSPPASRSMLVGASICVMAVCMLALMVTCFAELAYVLGAGLVDVELRGRHVRALCPMLAAPCRRLDRIKREREDYFYKGF